MLNFKNFVLNKKYLILLLMIFSFSSEAQQQAQGFAVDRLYQSSPGAGWFVMDTLDQHGGLGGVAAFSLNYAQHPLRVSNGNQQLAVVSREMNEDVGLAVTYRYLRFYANFNTPLFVVGDSGAVGNYSFHGPSVDWGTAPDNFSDVRLGVNTRFLGEAKSEFRMGAGAQLYLPSDNRDNYDTDGTLRGMLRLLMAGDSSHFSYAGHLGFHLRPVDDTPIPESPEGNEFLFGLAGGTKWKTDSEHLIIVGPEIYGVTALRYIPSYATTALEALLSARWESCTAEGRQIRVKLGFGTGMNQQFGTPDWRYVFAVELFQNGTDSGI